MMRGIPVRVEAVKPDAVVRAEAALRARVESWHPVTARIGNDRGRWLVRLAKGGSAFVKAAYDEASAEWLCTEALVYQGVQGSFLPRLLAWDGEVLVLEDLSNAAWPPPWSAEAVAAVRATLDDLAEVTPPAGLPSLEHVRELLVDTGWPAIEADPEAFLSLGLCDREWLETALPELRGAAAAVDLGGSSLVHVDIRSDNLCLRDGRAVLFDWNQASVGNPLFDLAEWLPSLAAEGGPLPEELLPHADGAAFAAAFAGLWGARAGLPAPTWGPKLRELQRLQAGTALSWAVRALDLPRATQAA
jgi:hypothetical protein